MSFFSGAFTFLLAPSTSGGSLELDPEPELSAIGVDTLAGEIRRFERQMADAR